MTVDAAMPLSELKPLPYAQRRKGMTLVGNGIDLIFKILDFIDAGCSKPELQAFIRKEYPDWMDSTIDTQTNVLRGDLRIVTYAGDRLVPTPLGIRLREERDPTLLFPHILTDFIGMDHVLVALRGGKRQRRRDLLDLLKSVHRGWTSDFGPSMQLRWLVELRIIESTDGTMGLTPAGESFARQVTWPLESAPPKLKAVAQEETKEFEVEGGENLEVPVLRAVFERIHADGALVFPESQVAALHAGLWAHARRHFAVFSGLSGSGKTSLAQAYGRALVELTGAEDAAARVLNVPVSPGWTDPTPLLGYVKPLSEDKSYEDPPFLKLLLRCTAHPDQIHVGILDEMNLSHPEQYLAPLLSAMELEDTPVVIHNHHEPIDGVPPVLPRYPKNLVLIGTINMDETTHTLSDKVLDRATTLEFWDVDLDKYPRWKTYKVPAADRDRAREVLAALIAELKPHRLHFAWRVIDDVLSFLERSEADGVLGGEAALDWVLYSKVLPKLRGHDTPALRASFEKCRQLMTAHHLERCAAKTKSLIDDLQATGSARFWR